MTDIYIAPNQTTSRCGWKLMVVWLWYNLYVCLSKRKKKRYKERNKKKERKMFWENLEGLQLRRSMFLILTGCLLSGVLCVFIFCVSFNWLRVSLSGVLLSLTFRFSCNRLYVSLFFSCLTFEFDSFWLDCLLYFLDLDSVFSSFFSLALYFDFLQLDYALSC